MSREKIPTGIERLLVTDIDNTLLGDEDGLRALIGGLESSANGVGFAIATGRNIDSARRILREWKVPAPDVWITSVGAEIHYGADLEPDAAWEEHIDDFWKPSEIRRALEGNSALELQPAEGQRRHKISYDVAPGCSEEIENVARSLCRRGLKANVIYSHHAYLDVLPARASKGKAVRYVATKLGIPLERCLVAGDSGNDEEMLCGGALAAVVGNYSEELATLRGRPKIYFATGNYAWGVLEAIYHYGFFEDART